MQCITHINKERNVLFLTVTIITIVMEQCPVHILPKFETKLTPSVTKFTALYSIFWAQKDRAYRSDICLIRTACIYNVMIQQFSCIAQYTHLCLSMIVRNMIPSAELGSRVRSDHDLSITGNLMFLDGSKHGASSFSSSASSSSTDILTQCTMSTQEYGNSVALHEWENRTPPRQSGGVKKKSGRHSNRECVGTRGRVGGNLWEAFQHNSQSVFYLHFSQLILS